MSLHIQVLIQDVNGQLEDQIDAVHGPALRSKKTRALKNEYKAAMKNPANYPNTRMADRDHIPLYLRPNGGVSDDVTFFFSQQFAVLFDRDPEIDEDFSSPDVPFINTVTGLADARVDARANPMGGAAPAGQEFMAGPFRLNSNCLNQKFYKFSLESAAYATLDPDIIVGT